MKRILFVAALVACRTVPNPPMQQPQPPAPAPEQAAAPAAPAPEAKPMTQTAAPQELAFPDEDFRKAQPQGAAPREFKLPPVKPFTLKNGIKVFLVEQHTLPIVWMDLNFDGGSVSLDDENEGALADGGIGLLISEGARSTDSIPIR